MLPPLSMRIWSCTVWNRRGNTRSGNTKTAQCLPLLVSSGGMSLMPLIYTVDPSTVVQQFHRACGLLYSCVQVKMYNVQIT